MFQKASYKNVVQYVVQFVFIEIYIAMVHAYIAV